MKYIIGADVGGTRIRAGIFRGERMIDFAENKTDNRGGRFVIEQIFEMIENFLGRIDRKSLIGIGVGLPGLVNSREGILYRAPNINGLRNINMGELLRERFHTKVFIENDVNCAALAEAKTRKESDLIFINLGTGVGVGIILNGIILRGRKRNIEAGHIIIGDEGRCNAGHFGCFEAFASGTGIEKYAKKFYSKGDVFAVLERARNGESKSKEIFNRVGKYLGIGIATLVNIFDTELVVLGGSVAGAYPYMKRSVLLELRRRAFSVPRISLTKLKYPGLAGARMIVEQNY